MTQSPVREEIDQLNNEISIKLDWFFRYANDALLQAYYNGDPAIIQQLKNIRDALANAKDNSIT